MVVLTRELVLENALLTKVDKESRASTRQIHKMSDLKE